MSFTLRGLLREGHDRVFVHMGIADEVVDDPLLEERLHLILTQLVAWRAVLTIIHEHISRQFGEGVASFYLIFICSQFLLYQGCTSLFVVFFYLIFLGFTTPQHQMLFCLLLFFFFYWDVP